MIVARVARGLPWRTVIEREDFEHSATLYLIEHIDRFRLDAGVHAFAYFRAIVNRTCLRRDLPREMRRNSRAAFFADIAPRPISHEHWEQPTVLDGAIPYAQAV